MNSAYFKSEAKKALQGKWQTFSVAVILYCVINSAMTVPSGISSVFSLVSDLELFELPVFFNDIYDIFSNNIVSVLSDIVYFLILPPFTYAISVMGLKVAKNEEIEAGNIFDGFRNYESVIILSLIEGLFTFLWTLLFIIPGVIKGLSYSMSNFILAEHPDMKATEILKESERLMDGHKTEFFLLNLSFIGWILLSFVTLHLSSIYSEPYIYTAQAEFYERIKLEKYGTHTYGEPDTSEEIIPE